ncbi:MAG: DNA replication and repair protein RecF [Muribaculaceae bacterium]|nr:DNA replication and repair protein RecF [Muribaculaceae bacterium]
MYLKSLSITNFKNIADARLEFSRGVNGLLGNNGMGKSNLLDAIYFLSFCKSFTGLTDQGVMRRGTDFFSLHGTYERHGSEEEVSAGMNRGKRKVVKRKGKEYDRLSQHIGVFPAVLVAPRDIELITGPGEERRKLMDMVISQSDASYLDALIRYGRSLEQRNKLLRAHVVDHHLYEAIEMSLAGSARRIHDTRCAWLPRFSELLSHYYGAIAGEGETASVDLKSHQNDEPDMCRLLDGSRRHDEAVGYTSVGPHRDDLIITIDGLDARRSASQGQCKSVTLGMRLAQYDFLRESTGQKPLFLLDDIFDKLDSTRVQRIVEIVKSDKFGQIFITDTNRDHLDNILRESGGERAMWHVERGVFTPHDAEL